MRPHSVFAAAVFLVCSLAAAPYAHATDLYPWANPHPVLNCVNRCLGLGWSDGYHAYGSRNSWMPVRPGHMWHAAQPSPWSPATSPPIHYNTAEPNLARPLPRPAFW
jgi:hypothetical protein